MSSERWLPVRGHEGLYEVSDLGRIRSLDRTVPHARSKVLTLRGRLLSASCDSKSGHLRVSLSKNGEVSTHFVHRAVADAFLANPDNKPMVLHWDDNPLNNRVENLRWGDQTQNMADLERNSGHHYGRRTHCKWGHEYTFENTYWAKSEVGGKDHRVCRKCSVRTSQEYKKRRKERNAA